MSLETFGQKLRKLRHTSGLTQAGLAEQLPVSPELISVWERAYQHRGRRWKPDRSSVLRLVEIFAGYLTPEEAQSWVSLLGYRLNPAELRQLFPNHAPPATSPASSLLTSPTRLKSVPLLTDQRLFGVAARLQQLRLILERPTAPWLVAIDGIGGIGKTSLAAAVARELLPAGHFADLVWVSAKPEEFLPATGLQPTHRPALDLDTLVNTLLEQLEPDLSLARSLEEKTALLTGRLQQQPYLIVIDNLETVADYQALLPWLRQLANPSKFLLTSRHSLHAHADVFCFSLPELDPADTFALLKYEAEVRGITALDQAAPVQLERIYQVVGGNPLALKLVVGQIRVLPLSQVLENLRQAQGKKVDELYTYIYWQAWQALDHPGRGVLLAMPLASGGTLAQLVALSEVRDVELNQALERLVTLSLVEIRGDLEQPRYYIHRLTETFLLTEVVKWQSLP